MSRRPASNDLGVEASVLREDASLAASTAKCSAWRKTRPAGDEGKLEAMGPVNMMALEEYNETAQRHAFLETQRKDLLDSIDNTQATIREIDEISRIKFDEAFARINENFSVTFANCSAAATHLCAYR